MASPVEGLPIEGIRSDLEREIQSRNRLVVVAPTGSGKTTQIPQYLLEAAGFSGKQILVLQPRRVAARAVARRVCQERGVSLGREVGYQVRFDDRTSDETRLVFMTEGVFLRRIQTEPNLDRVGVVILDEFHERSLQADVALGLIKAIQQRQRKDLTVIVMSATLDVDPILDYLAPRGGAECPVLSAEGRAFPVTIVYENGRDRRWVTDRAAERVLQIARSTEGGDVLVFMPGMGEINATARRLRELRLGEDFEILPLHGDLPPDQQDRVFQSNERRKVIVATNVAESSITIEGVRYVVDGGLARVARFNAESGLGSLEIEEISQASADQRAGRAGRVGPGICYRLWTESGQLNRLPQTTPEIQRTELSEVVLQLSALGVQEVKGFDWLDRPDPMAVDRAEALLRRMGALHRNQGVTALTDVGRQMLRLPIEPRFARMLIEGDRQGCFDQAALWAALVSGRGLLVRGAKADRSLEAAQEPFREDERSDFFTLTKAFQMVREGGFRMSECRHYGVNRQVALSVDEVHRQLTQLGQRIGLGVTSQKTDDVQIGESVLKCLLAGFSDHLCRRTSRGTLECDLQGGRRGTLARESVVQESEFFVGTEIRTISSSKRGALTLITLASHVEPDWLKEVCPEHVHRNVEHHYDQTQKRVEVLETTRFGDLLVAEEKTKDFDPEASGRCLAEAWANERISLPLFDHRVEQFLLRTALLAHHHPDLKQRALEKDDQIAVIARALKGERLTKEAQRRPLLPEFLKALSQEVREWLEMLYPERWTWVDGSERKLVYHLPRKKTGGEHVEALLNVSITECFRLESHPVLGEGTLPVTLILGVPKGKELARTQDWISFKAREYPSLKNRWKQKYPTVTWP